jgi:hypothetical protein
MACFSVAMAAGVDCGHGCVRQTAFPFACPPPNLTLSLVTHLPVASQITAVSSRTWCAARLPVYTARGGNIKLARLFVSSKRASNSASWTLASICPPTSVASSMYLVALSGLLPTPKRSLYPRIHVAGVFSSLQAGI